MAHLSRRRGGLEDVRASSSLPTIIPSLKFEFSRPLFDRELPLNFLMFVCRRLAKDKNTSHIYILSDKLVSVTEAGKVSANFDYHPDGQIASVTYADGRRENYLWDGLALIHRNGTDILNEPAITGGNPVLSGDKVLFNDLLGNTLGVKDQSSYQPIRMTAFGESDNADAFFTGKPLVGELGYTFLFRNYRPEQGKWQTSDPLGYPDGWNNFAYVGNAVSENVDYMGMWATGIAYPASELPATVASDTLLANRAYQYFLDRNAQLSAALVHRIMTSTSSTLSDVTISKNYTDRIQKDTGFGKVIDFINEKMDSANAGDVVSFDNQVSTTLVSDYDLANSIHGVVFTVTGSILKTDNSSGTLNISFSDPYDFDKNADDWKVRIFGRLYHYGWISKFNVKGSFTIHVEE